MPDARWLRVQSVFSAAIECEPSERDALLARECREDAEPRREVKSLLAAHESSGLVDQLASEISAPSLWRARVDEMDWQGRSVAQYFVIEPLAAGAMGLVYRARDERLGRQVALKFLPSHLSTQSQAQQRFLLEARAAAALDHPNICTIHEIGTTLRRATVHRHALVRRRDTAGATRARATLLARGARDHLAGCDRTRQGTRALGGSSRREAIECDAAGRWHGEGARFRCGASRGRVTDEPGQRHRRHGGVHEPRAGSRGNDRCAHRHLVARRRAPRNARGRRGRFAATTRKRCWPR